MGASGNAIIWPRLVGAGPRPAKPNGASADGRPGTRSLTGRLGKTPRQGGRGEGERVPLYPPALEKPAACRIPASSRFGEDGGATAASPCAIGPITIVWP